MARMTILSVSEWEARYSSFAGVMPEKIPDEVYCADCLDFGTEKAERWVNLQNGHCLLYSADYWLCFPSEDAAAEPGYSGADHQWIDLSHVPGADPELVLAYLTDAQADEIIASESAQFFQGASQ